MSKILLADDSPTELAFLQKALQPLGHALVLAREGGAVLPLAERERPDLIVLDVVMPGLDGFQICRQLRVHASLRGVPVVIVSVKQSRSDRFWGLKQGANEYLGKPVDAAALQEAVRRHLPA